MIALLLGPFGRLVGGAFIVLLALGWSHHAGYKAGIANQKAEDAKVAYIAQVAAEVETGRLQAAADKAQQEKDRAQTDLNVYRASHPVSVRVCHSSPVHSDLSQGASSQPAGAEAGNVLQHEAAGTDIGPALDELMASADATNESYRLCRTAYMALN
jgi:hypothetical protein